MDVTEREVEGKQLKLWLIAREFFFRLAYKIKQLFSLENVYNRFISLTWSDSKISLLFLKHCSWRVFEVLLTWKHDLCCRECENETNSYGHIKISSATKALENIIYVCRGGNDSDLQNLKVIRHLKFQRWKQLKVEHELHLEFATNKLTPEIRS